MNQDNKQLELQFGNINQTVLETKNNNVISIDIARNKKINNKNKDMYKSIINSVKHLV